mgnify:CR=1 FL=1
MTLEWRWYEWQELPPDVLHAFLKLRSDIFVVEQNCVFSDMDGRDPACTHLCGFAGNELVAYLRLVPPGLKSPEAALGRLVVLKTQRGHGHSRRAIEIGLARCAERHPGVAVRIQAQAHLAPFYQSLGFVTHSAEYLEDGIPHVDMLRN